MNELLRCSATEVARKIADREVTIETVVETVIREQERLNPHLNALVENCWDEAREDARQKDLELKKGLKNLPPFFGVPITIKEMIAVAGCRQTLGSIHRRDWIQSQDATVVARMRKAGAIVIGTSNVPELGFWFECENPVYGWTRNPYDLERTSGGSSGGEGALVGSGSSILGIGSDVGGSIRMPAAFCGIFGHKPSNRIVPISGHYPVDMATAGDYKDPKYPLTTMGPMAKSAKDLRPVMEILIGPDGIDPQVKSGFRMKPPITDWSGKTVWVLADPYVFASSRCTNEVSESTEIAGQYFESLGAKVKTMRSDYLKDAVLHWSAALSEVIGRTFEDVLFSTAPPSLLSETLRTLARQKINYTLPALITVMIERMMEKSNAQFSQSTSKRQKAFHEMRAKINELLQDGLLLCPTHPRPAPLHHGTYTRPFDFALTGVFNALGLPATAIPVGEHQGLPLSVQAISAWGNDHSTISAAETLESAFGGWKPPEQLSKLGGS